MDLDKQKNFYDHKRYFQGKDNPGDAHPEPKAGAVSRGQITFGVLFLAAIVALFALSLTSPPELAPQKAPGAAKAQATAAAHQAP
jgi:hypothetical protein